MRPWALTGFFLGIGLGGSLALAGDDEPPMLLPPAGSASEVEPESGSEAPALLPELRRPLAPAPGPLPDLVPPPLTGPAEMERTTPHDAPVPTPAAHQPRSNPVAALPARPAPPMRRERLWNRLTPAVAARDRKPDATIAVVPRSDPAADAALKRRLEAQVRGAVGGPLRSLEVRVAGRDVAIRARVDRFWRRRGVRRAIEALPSLAGYRARVEVTE
jgi:hypothetical protein